MRKENKVDQFYADLFMSIAEKLVTRPGDLVAACSVMSSAQNADGFRERERKPDTLKRFMVNVQGHANDSGLLIGKKASHVLSFKVLLREAAAKRGEFCDLAIDEGFGIKTAPVSVPLDPTWNRDQEFAELVWDVADKCFPGIMRVEARSEGGVTTIRIESVRGIAEEAFAAMETLFKACGRTAGRTLRLEQ